MNGSSSLGVVVAGGGIAGLEALLTLHDLAGDRVSLTLLEPRTELVLRALEPAEPFGAGEAGRLEVEEIARATSAEIVRSALDRVDPDARVVVTRDGTRIAYDALLVAVGARPVIALRDALTWWPGGHHAEFSKLLTDAVDGRADQIAFVVPSLCPWSLPVYELALMTARHLEHHRGSAGLRLITPEPAPLAIFGPVGSAAVARELDDAGVAFTGNAVAAVRGSEPVVVDAWPGSRRFAVDRVVTLPRAYGPAIPGLRPDIEGFLVTDEHGRVHGTPRVWAAGDATNRRPMHGGLAALQAECAARHIAALAGAPLRPRACTPVLRAQLRTGHGSLWLQRDISDPLDAGAAASLPLWSPPGKIAARRLGAVLAEHDRPGGLALQRAG
jgi:sulfide:quinone oxidoreductase